MQKVWCVLSLKRGIIGFSVKNELAFVSHLEIVTMFERFFRKNQIKLDYSQGFNPHPKIVIPVPRSTGVESAAEYLEFIFEDCDIEVLKKCLPERIGKIFLLEKCDLNDKKLSGKIQSIKYRFYGKIENMPETKGYKSLIKAFKTDYGFELETEADFSFSRFTKEMNFEQVEREIILK